MGNKLELVGETFGRLKVIAEIIERSKSGQVYWLCQCSCGKLMTVRGNSLKRGNTKSCGCLSSEMRTTHGMARTAIYICWQDMLKRCYNKNYKQYKDYGGRGIKVCNEWHLFENFYFDMGDRPEGLTLDRINNNKGYYNPNCKWSTRKEQQNNQRNNIKHTVKAPLWTEDLANTIRRSNPFGI